MNKCKEHQNRNLGGEEVPTGIVRCSLIRDGVRVLVDQKIDRAFQRRIEERKLAEERRARIANAALNNPANYTIIVGQDGTVTYVRVI